jgi:hypothetical protein
LKSFAPFHVASGKLGTPSLHRLERGRIADLPFDFASEANADSRNSKVGRLLSVASEGLGIFHTFCQCPKPKTWQMVKIVWIDSAIEDLNAIGEPLVELPEPKPKKKKKL